ncbi:hypothetical protein FQN50_003253 [Emmonsiellopsis sp. PD_5]|nr:hypothetical protein FQN50_003253 [Emmonsiellopsis sp. PD_5]
MAPIKVAEISRPDSESLNLNEALISNVKQLSSYNWIEAPAPTIAVPGSPSLWSPPKTAQKLKKDSGLIYIAQNAARHPKSPMEPLFRALLVSNPSFDINSVDVVTDRNNIRKLLSFASPSLTDTRLEPFTIDIEIINDTAVFCRAETRTSEFIGPQDFIGFGHEFEKAYTTNQIVGSTGHHRILSYQFGDLKFIVRHETDGYIDGSVKESTERTELGDDDLSGMLGTLSLGPSESLSHAAPFDSKLIIKEKGHEVPTESTLELKTRVFHRPIDIQQVIPQLWVSQTPNLVRAYHRNGLFEQPRVEDVSSKIERWERDHQVDLMKLAALIKRIIDAVRDIGGNATIKYDTLLDKLVVWKVEARKMLPDDLYSILENKNTIAR